MTACPEAEVTGPITIDQLGAFARASRDTNPIHFSPDVARAAGLPAPVVHGMLIAGRFETYLERLAGYELAELKVRFVRPVPAGSSLTITARRVDAGGPWLHLRLLAKIGGDVLAAVGEAKLRPFSSQAEEHAEPRQAGTCDQP